MRDAYQCVHCRRVVTGKAAHVDHIVPKSHGGSDLLDNLQTLCASCHAKKEGWKAAKGARQTGSAAKCNSQKTLAEKI